MADNADIDVELDCDEIVFEWSDADDSQTCNLPPCYGGHRLQTDIVYGQINVYGVTTKSERHKRSYWTRTADGNGIGGRKAPVPYGS